MVKLQKYKYIPNILPPSVIGIPFNESWNDDILITNQNAIYAFIDGSVYFKDKDPKAHIYGHGGGSILIYHGNKLIKKGIYPTTTRTHINTMELLMFLKTFEWINKNLLKIKDNQNIQELRIISDSQNCLKIIQNKTYPKDEILRNIQKKIDTELNKKIITNLPENFIKLQWVESHADSHYNNQVDVYAKIAALLVMYIADNDRDEEILFNPNNHISFTTIKNEIKYKIYLSEKNKWNDYKYERKNEITKWSSHYFKWNISYTPNYGNDLLFLTKIQNDIRIMLLTNHLPLNLFKNHFLKEKKIPPHCEYEECKNENIYETLNHFMLLCPKYKKERDIMLKNIKTIYQKHNNNEKNIKKKIEYIENRNNENMLKYIIFPSTKMQMNMRIDIIKNAINYVIHTNRISKKNILD